MKRENFPRITINEWKGIIKSYFIRFCMILLFWIPLKDNCIMINNHARKGFSCNPKYLASALLKQYGNAVELYWVSQYPESCQELERLAIPVIRANSWKHIRKYFTSKIYITNDAFPHWARHRRKQIWINTWHGAMNYKHIGYDYLPVMNILAKKLFRLKNRRPDLFVAGSLFFAKNTASSFHFPADIFFPCGLPRNDVFFQSNREIRQKVLRQLGIEDTRNVLLYAPTFRDSGQSSTYGMDVMQVHDALQQRFGGNWIILFRNHSFVEEDEQNTGTMIDVSDYEDMQELLLATDVLISDYSSCMWDFSLQRRPCFVYAPDLENYRDRERDFAYPLSRWPYPIAKTNLELIENILTFHEADYLEKIAAHHEDAGRCDQGTATKQLLEKISLMM